MRISREQMLMEWAYTASKRGTCGRLAVGAIIAKNFRPISAGYVGAPSGELHCEEAKCDLSQPCTRTKHAEHNAIEFATSHNLDTSDADMFVTDAPCYSCAGLIVAAGIRRVFYDREYRMKEGVLFLLSCYVEVHRVLPNGIIRQVHKDEIRLG